VPPKAEPALLVERLLDGVGAEVALGERVVGRLWATWRARHGAEAQVPEDFAAVLDALDVATCASLIEAAKVDVAE